MARQRRTLTRIVRFIQRSPAAIDPRVDPNRIILVGHSFGASAVAIALAEGAPAAGAILWILRESAGNCHSSCGKSISP